VGDGVRDGVRAGVRDGVWDGVGAGVWDGVRDGVWDGVRDGVRDGVGAGVGDGVLAGVRDGVRDGVGAGVSDGVSAGVRDGVWAGVRAGVSDGVSAGVWDGVWAGVRDGVGDGVSAGVNPWPEVGYGCHDADWLAFYDWYRRNGLEGATAPLLGLTRVARSSGWHWLHRGFAVITDRPAVLHDERVAGTAYLRRLHCSTGPSVAYRDGWSLWHWHGVSVPQWAIEADDPTGQIATEHNTEIRRCAIERYGWDRYLDRIGVTPVSVQADPGNAGHELRLYDLPRDHQVYGAPVRLLVMDNASRDRDGTRRRFAETVPADVPDAVAAAAWQFGVDRGVYAGLERAS